MFVKGSAKEKIISRGKDRILEIQKVSYSDEGDWICLARNTFKGMHMQFLIDIHLKTWFSLSGSNRRVSSKPVRVAVTGAPQILAFKNEQEFNKIEKSEEMLEMNFESGAEVTRFRERVWWNLYEMSLFVEG